MNIANKFTVLRILLVPLFFLAAHREAETSFMIRSALLFAAASCTDFIDGYLARKYQLITDFGKFMDPLADKILVAAALIVLVEKGLTPAWMVVLIISREYAISILRAIAASSGKVLAASKGGKLKTALQMFAILFLLLGIPYGDVLMILAVIQTAISGADYIWKNRSLIAQMK